MSRAKLIRHKNWSRHSRGFSLLEIMIVVVILGVLVSIFTLSFGSFSDDLTREHGLRLKALIDLATEEASMQGREIGLRFYQHGYEFSVRAAAVDEDGRQFWEWVPLEGDRLLRARDLGEEFSLELFIEGKEVDLDLRRNEKDAYEPQIFLFSSGDLLPAFTARINAAFGDETVGLTAATDGSVEIKEDEY